MKKPVKPSEPNKPIMPSEIAKISHRVNLETIIPVSKNITGISLSDIIDCLPKHLSIKPSDIYLMVEEEFSPYEDSYNNYYLQYFTEQADPDFDKNKKIYEEKSKEYGKKLGSYNKKLEKFKEDKKEYDIFSAEKAKENKAKEIEVLEKRLAKLKE